VSLQKNNCVKFMPELNAKLEGEVNVIFIRAGISKKSNPYMQVSNGRAEIFLDIPKGVDHDEFTDWCGEFEEDALITIPVRVTVGSDGVTLLWDQVQGHLRG